MLTHHAYYIEDSSALFEEYKKRVPHFVAQKYERFGVDEARTLSQLASLKNVSTESVYLIAFGTITSEAQQALLKLFEEPQEGTVFVVLAPHGALMPTLKSRMLQYPGEAMSGKKSSDLLSGAKNAPAGQTILPNTSVTLSAIAFLRASGKERSDFIAKLLKDDDAAKERVRDFVNALEVELVRLNLTAKAEIRQALSDIAVVRGYLGDRAPSLKMLLEHLALSLPVV